MRSKIIKVLNSLPYVRKLYESNRAYRNKFFVEPGHYYSPLVTPASLNENHLENLENDNLKGIELNVEEQLQLVEELSLFYNDIPFCSTKKQNLTYFYENPFYSYTDGIILYSIIRKYKPKRIVEVGSGFSSAVMIDTNDLFFDGKIDLTFIEPHPERFYSTIGENNIQKYILIKEKVQDVDLKTFRDLRGGDILFIDSSHVLKTGSDVNHLLFQILPILNKGVLIHFHDIFYPFEYPKEWILSGRSWNEIYALRAFLMYNSDFKILLFSHFVHKKHPLAFEKMPLAYKNRGGNIWLRKI